MSTRHILGMLAVLPFTACSSRDPSVVEVQGTVEVRDIDVAPLAAGRVVVMRVDEGESVAAGDTIAILTAPTLDADLDGARARLAVAEATLRDLETGGRSQEVAAAEAELRAAESEAMRLGRERERVAALYAAGAVAPRELEAATSAATVATARAGAAAEAVSLVRSASRPARIAAARGEVASARAALLGREAVAAEFVVTAAAAGVVLSRIAEPGDLVAAGRPVAVLGMMDTPWVRVFVPARVLPMITLGMSAAIYPPGAGGADGAGAAAAGPAVGRVIAITPQAEYVTRTALTEDERADLLFGVKVAIDDPAGRFKPGLPVIVRLSLARSDSAP